MIAARSGKCGALIAQFYIGYLKLKTRGIWVTVQLAPWKTSGKHWQDIRVSILRGRYG
jgi:hypothetical protein